MIKEDFIKLKKNVEGIKRRDSMHYLMESCYGNNQKFVTGLDGVAKWLDGVCNGVFIRPCDIKSLKLPLSHTICALFGLIPNTNYLTNGQWNGSILRKEDIPKDVEIVYFNKPGCNIYDYIEVYD